MSTHRILLCGEAFGEAEEREGRPFVGASGWHLDQMLSSVGIARRECYATNVFNLRPRPTNDVKNLCGPKSEAIPAMPMLSSGKYVRAEFAPELARLYKEIEDVRPNVVVALGGTAAWALCRTSGIRNIRGAPLLGVGGVKVLPTYHPAAMLRDYSLRPIIVADLAKAKRESAYPDIRRPQREIWIEPALQDISLYFHEHLQGAKRIAADIETKGDQITCIGFSPSPSSALVIPFYNPSHPDGNYWRTREEEIAAWGWVRRMLALPARFIFQNGLFDLHFLWRRYGLVCPGAEEDTMLMHHALQPEMEKGLGFLGTVYTDEASWKFMRKKHDTVKRED